MKTYKKMAIVGLAESMYTIRMIANINVKKNVAARRKRKKNDIVNKRASNNRIL